MIGGRLPKTDAETGAAMQEIFSGDAIRTNIAYLDQLKPLFTRFVHENFNE